MNVLVMEPHTRHSGATTIAGLLGMELASRGQRTCLTHLNTNCFAINYYFGLDRLAGDKTASPSKLATMLREKIISTKEASNYCRNIAKDFDILTVNDKKMTPDTLKTLLWFELTSFPYDVMVYDMDVESYDTEEAKLAIDRADLIIWVFNQSILEVRDFKEMTVKLSKLLAKPSMAIVNKFDRQISTVKDVQSEISSKEMSKENSWLRLRYNPMVCKYTNGGSLNFLHANMRNGDYATLDIQGDMAQIANRVMRFGRKLKSQLSKNRAEIRDRELDKFHAKAAEALGDGVLQGLEQRAGKEQAEEQTEGQTERQTEGQTEGQKFGFSAPPVQSTEPNATPLAQT